MLVKDQTGISDQSALTNGSHSDQFNCFRGLVNVATRKSFWGHISTQLASIFVGAFRSFRKRSCLSFTRGFQHHSPQSNSPSSFRCQGCVFSLEWILTEPVLLQLRRSIFSSPSINVYTVLIILIDFRAIKTSKSWCIWMLCQCYIHNALNFEALFGASCI